MLLKRKVDRAMEWSRKRRMREDGRDPEKEELEAEIKKAGKGKGEDLPSMEELRKEEIEKLSKEPIEKKDTFSMIVSAFITIFPACVGVLLLICLIVLLFFRVL